MQDIIAIGRKDELRQLLEVVQMAGKTRGGVIFIEGLAGMGKSTLIRMFLEALESPSQDQPATAVSGYCYEVSGSNDAYEPFKEILRNLAGPQQRPHIAKLVLRLLKERDTTCLASFPVYRQQLRRQKLALREHRLSVTGHLVLTTKRR